MPIQHTKGSRYETNQRVKKVLVRHGVSLTLLKWSSSKTTTYFYGILKKDSEEDFTFQGLEALVKDLLHMPRGPRIRFSLENWDIGSDGGTVKIAKKKKPVEMDVLVEQTRTVVIQSVESPPGHPAERAESADPVQENGDSTNKDQ